MRADLKLHFVAGVAAALFGWLLAAICALALHEPARHVALAPFVAAAAAGLTKEFADWLDNRSMGVTHDVSLLDALVTAAPGAALSLGLILAAS